MGKRIKNILAAVAVVVAGSSIMFSSRARAPKIVSNRPGPDFYRDQPKDMAGPREKLEKESLADEEMMKPCNAGLEDLTEDKLSVGEAEARLAEVDLLTGAREMKIDDLWVDYKARLKELHKACRTKPMQPLIATFRKDSPKPVRHLSRYPTILSRKHRHPPPAEWPQAA